MVKIVSFQNNKGGVAKTTMTTNVAGVLALNGKKVLIVDADPQGNSAVAFNVNPNDIENTLYDVLVDEYPIEKVIINVAENIDMVPSNDDLDYFDLDIYSNKSKYPYPFFLMKRAMKSIEDNYDYILLDTSPSMSLVNMNVFCYTDSIVVPFVLDKTALKGIVKITSKINEFKAENNQSLAMKAVVPVMVEDRTNLHKRVIQEVIEYMEHKDVVVAENYITKSIKFAESVTDRGLPAVYTEKNNNAVEAYFRLVDELIEKGVL